MGWYQNRIQSRLDSWNTEDFLRYNISNALSWELDQISLQGRYSAAELQSRRGARECKETDRESWLRLGTLSFPSWIKYVGRRRQELRKDRSSFFRPMSTSWTKFLFISSLANKHYFSTHCEFTYLQKAMHIQSKNIRMEVIQCFWNLSIYKKISMCTVSALWN
jgi:hypothetical protein